MPDGFQRRQIVTRAHLFRQAPDAAHHRRHQIDPGRLVLGDQTQRRFRVELRHDDDRRADLQRREYGDERSVVIERARHQHDVVARISQNSAIGGAATPGCPATISFGRPVEPPDVGAFHAGAMRSGRSLSSRSAASSSAIDRAGPADMFRRRADDDGRFGEFDERFQFRMRQPPRHGLRDRAQFPRRVTRFHEFDAVRQRDGEEIALFDAVLFKRAGDAVGVAMEFVPAPALAFAGDGKRIALNGGLTRECRADGNFCRFRHSINP